MITLSQFGALTILLAVMVFGEWLAGKTKGVVPSAFTISVLLLIGFWTVIPTDLAATSGLSSGIFNISVMMLVTHLGTLISKDQMIAQWKTVVICLIAIATICLFTLTIGAAVFGWTNAVAATPVLTGAAVAATIMQQAAAAKGDTIAALVAIVTMIMQGLVAYPIVAFLLRKETQRLMGIADTLPGTVEQTAGKNGNGKEKHASSTNVILLKVAILSLAAYYLDKLTGGHVSRYVWALVLGFAAHELGFLESNALGEAKSDGFLMFVLMGFLFASSLASATPENFFPVAGITFSLVVLSAIGMAIVSYIVSKVTKSSFYMTYTIALNAYLGFPVNVILTNEAVNNATDDPVMRDKLSTEIMPKMLVAGFTSVTIVSVLVAGVLVNFI